MKINIEKLIKYLSFIAIIVLFHSCKSSADKTFEFNFSTDFAIGEYEIYEGINTLGNLNLQDAFLNKLKDEGSSIDKLHEVKISSAYLAIIDTFVSFDDLNNFTIDILGQSKDATMKTIANASDVRANSSKAELNFTKDDLGTYFKDGNIFIIPSAEAKKDLPDAFGLNIDITFVVGVKN